MLYWVVNLIPWRTTDMSTIYLGKRLHKHYGAFYTSFSKVKKYLSEIFISIWSQCFSIIFAYIKSNIKKEQNVENKFKMGEPQFTQKLDIQQTVKYGLLLYLVAGILAIPSGICGSAYKSPIFNLPLIAAHPVSEGFNISNDLTQIPNAESTAEEQSEHQPKQAEDPNTPPFHSHILRACRIYDVDVALIRAIIMAESSNNPRAVSRRGAKGLMQLMPITAKSLGIEDAFDPALNIDGGVRYFKKLLDRFDGDVKLALAAYNAGSRYVRKYGGIPPFRATHIYIRKVLKYQRKYQKEMASNRITIAMR